MLGFGAGAQSSLSDTQMQNARATGYAIVAAKNPGRDFSIIVKKWDGSSTLEQTANQINGGWHAQAAIKGNYFSQSFDGSNFTVYSSVVTSEQSFDLYKANGTEWYVICSTLPPFSEQVNFTKKVGIGTTAPEAKLHVVSDGGTAKLYVGYGSSNYYDAGNHYFRGQSSSGNRMRIAPSGNVIIGSFDDNELGKLQVNGNIWSSGSLAIGTTGPVSNEYKLAVGGLVTAEKVRISKQTNWSDFVFEPNYTLPDLNDVKQYLTTHKQLPDIPSFMQAQGDIVKSIIDNLSQAGVKCNSCPSITQNLIKLYMKSIDQHLDDLVYVVANFGNKEGFFRNK